MRKTCLSLGDSGLIVITHKVIIQVYKKIIKITVDEYRNMWKIFKNKSAN